MKRRADCSFNLAMHTGVKFGAREDPAATERKTRKQRNNVPSDASHRAVCAAYVSCLSFSFRFLVLNQSGRKGGQREKGGMGPTPPAHCFLPPLQPPSTKHMALSLSLAAARCGGPGGLELNACVVVVPRFDWWGFPDCEDSKNKRTTQKPHARTRRRRRGCWCLWSHHRPFPLSVHAKNCTKR